MTIVAGPEVSGTVTIQLNDVPWQQALEVILQTYGYAYERRGNIIVVATVENIKKRREDAMILAEQVPLETATFSLNFGKASEVIESVSKMRSDRGHIDFDERTNTEKSIKFRALIEGHYKIEMSELNSLAKKIALQSEYAI